jgi:hypothetical protein
VLLDEWSPRWTRRIKIGDDLAQLVRAAAPIQPSEDAAAIAKSYGGEELHIAEAKRDTEQKARVAELRRRFVEGPVLVLPGARTTSFGTNGMTPIPGEGMVYPGFRGSDDWGSVEASTILKATDGSKLTLAAPAVTEGATLSGDGWTVNLKPGWVVQPGNRKGDFQVVKDAGAKR